MTIKTKIEDIIGYSTYMTLGIIDHKLNLNSKIIKRINDYIFMNFTYGMIYDDILDDLLYNKEVE